MAKVRETSASLTSSRSTVTVLAFFRVKNQFVCILWVQNHIGCKVSDLPEVEATFGGSRGIADRPVSHVGNQMSL